MLDDARPPSSAAARRASGTSSIGECRASSSATRARRRRCRDLDPGLDERDRQGEPHVAEPERRRRRVGTHGVRRSRSRSAPIGAGAVRRRVEPLRPEDCVLGDRLAGGWLSARPTSAVTFPSWGCFEVRLESDDDVAGGQVDGRSRGGGEVMVGVLATAAVRCPSNPRSPNASSSWSRRSAGRPG